MIFIFVTATRSSSNILSGNYLWLCQILDADMGKRLESSTGRVATRDIVQFVPMREVQGQYQFRILSPSTYSSSLLIVPPLKTSVTDRRRFYQQVGRSPLSRACWRSCLGSSWSTCAPGTSSRDSPSTPRRRQPTPLLPSCEGTPPGPPPHTSWSARMYQLAIVDPAVYLSDQLPSPLLSTSYVRY